MDSEQTDTTIFTLNNGEKLKQYLIDKWNELANTENVFRYKLDVKEQKILEGKFKFLIQLNRDRIAKRRAPQAITSIVPAFNPNDFNFNKINSKEVLLKVTNGETVVTFLINNSPLTKYHSLLCPDLARNQPQILTRNSITFGLNILKYFNDSNYKIGYNSPGALASVNHLHLHLIYLEQPLYIEDIALKPLVKHVFKISSNENMVNGFCFQCCTQDNIIEETATDVMILINYFCKNQIPHNIFMTYGNQNKSTKIFIFPRDRTCAPKEFSTFNVAFCELSGYVPIGNTETYECITEAILLDKISTDMGNVTDKIELDVIKLFSNR